MSLLEVTYTEHSLSDCTGSLQITKSTESTCSVALNPFLVSDAEFFHCIIPCSHIKQIKHVQYNHHVPSYNTCYVNDNIILYQTRILVLQLVKCYYRTVKALRAGLSQSHQGSAKAHLLCLVVNPGIFLLYFITIF